MWITRNLASAIVIFLLKINEARSGCNWPGKCLLQCIDSNSTIVISQIEELYAKDEECHNDGVILRLRSLSYPNNTIGPNWFNAVLNVKQLEVYLDGVSVSADAFNADAFRMLKIVIFQKFKIALVPNGIFNGLDQLEVLNIKSAEGVSKIDAGVLDSLTELQELTFDQTSVNAELSINGLTGSAPLSKLEYVKIRYNLGNLIKTSSFNGLTSVKRLDLSSCKIISIGDNAFDPISGTIEELNLSSNSLTTLSYSVFSMALPNIKMINIDENKWDCECHLMHFRLYVQQYQDIFSGIHCTTPTYCKVSNMECETFDECDEPTTTTSVATTPTTTTITTTAITTTTTSSPDTNLSVECYNELEIRTETVSIKRPISLITISENENGEANLMVESEQDDASLVVIWFDDKLNSGDIGQGIKCIRIKELTTIPITGLQNDILYSFCLIDKTDTSVSPLDCVSYVKRQVNPVWLFDSSKPLTVSLVTISLVLNVFVGIVIGLWIINYNSFCTESNQTTKISMESKDLVNLGEVYKEGRISNIYIRNTILTACQQDTFKCPPLPERPRKFFDEPIYASVD